MSINNMQSIHNILIFLSILFNYCYANITLVNTMQDMMRYFENADCGTLAIFDIDMVLIQPSDPAFQMATMKRYSAAVKRISQSIPPEKKELFLTFMLLSSDSILIEDSTPFFLQKLACMGIPTIALTANLTGQLANIQNLESWKIGRLRKCGIDFTCSTPLKEDAIFCDLPSYRGNYSVYKDGVLFANGAVCPKGDVLIRFLQMVDRCPRRIVFIDDREDNLKNVESALLKHCPHIQYEGIHYLGAKDYPSLSIPEEEFEMKWEAVAAQTRQSN